MTAAAQSAQNVQDWCQCPARDVVSALKAGEVSPLELLDELEAQVQRLDKAINALPTLCFDDARRRARQLMSVAPKERGVLCGLPVPIKDSIQVRNVRTTFGSTVFENHVPQHSDAIVTTLEGNGAIVFAKSNTPEFEAGANTFNDVFGATVNPWDHTKSAGGSSGGAAAAVASHQAWLAQGTDFACSLRNPASFCGVVGLRPSPGLIAQGPNSTPYQTLSVPGPIGRDVEDVALMLDAMVGFDALDPLSFPPSAVPYLDAARQDTEARRVAYSPTLGITTLDLQVAEVCERAVERLARGSWSVDRGQPVLANVHETFRVLRAHQFAATRGELLTHHGAQLKPEVQWNIEEGMKLDGEKIISAERHRGVIRRQFLEFFDVYDFLITPAAIVPPYPVEKRYVDECAGRRFDNYLEWMAISYAVTLASCPAISIPAGFTEGGLPIGLQIVAPPRAEARLLSFAHKCEMILEVDRAVPA